MIAGFPGSLPKFASSKILRKILTKIEDFFINIPTMPVKI